jgi:hypothetical protein
MMFRVAGERPIALADENTPPFKARLVTKAGHGSPPAILNNPKSALA